MGTILTNSAFITPVIATGVAVILAALSVLSLLAIPVVIKSKLREMKQLIQYQRS